MAVEENKAVEITMAATLFADFFFLLLVNRCWPTNYHYHQCMEKAILLGIL